METKVKTHHQLYEALGAIVGSKHVTDDDFALIAYSRDISAFAPSIPGIIVRPGSTEEVSLIVKLANRTGYPITLKGGGQSGGGVTTGEPRRHILVDTGRMDKVKVDTENLMVTFGGGIHPSMLDDALRPYGYYANTVIGPYYTASMAGVIGGIAGGGFSKDVAVRGCNWASILGLKVVLPNGDIITTGAGPDTNIMRDEIQFREVSAPDLTGLFVASGGALGIITEAAMRIYPIPKVTRGYSFIAQSLEDVWAINLELSKKNPIPFNNIFMFPLTNFMISSMTADLEGYAAIFVSLEGETDADFDTRYELIKNVCFAHGCTVGTPALDQYAEYGSTGTCDHVHNVCSMACPFMTWEAILPRDISLEYAKGLVALAEAFPGNEKYHTGPSLYVLPVSNVMLVGITLHWNNLEPGAEDHMQRLWRAGADYIQKYGVSVVYCQGSNSNLLSKFWSPTYSKTIGLIKKAFDPNGILCPGLWDM